MEAAEGQCGGRGALLFGGGLPGRCGGSGSFGTSREFAALPFATFVGSGDGVLVSGWKPVSGRETAACRCRFPRWAAAVLGRLEGREGAWRGHLMAFQGLRFWGW